MFGGKKVIVLIIAAILLIVIGVAIYFGMTYFKSTGPVTLTYWGVWEPESVFSEVVADYQKLHPNVTVKYRKMASTGYRERLSAALASGTEPDIARIHNTWLPMMKTGIAPFPGSIYSVSDFKRDFYPVVSSDLTDGRQVYAVPLGVDTIVMYVNSDIFTAAGFSIPTSWEEFAETTNKLTVRDESGKIKTSGAALGTASNVDNWQDVLGLMMVQAGVDLNRDPGSVAASEALGFYTGFVNAQQVWDETLDQSTLAFATGKTAVFFGPSWRYFDIKAINPDLSFQVAPVPQLANSTNVTYATYWAEAVSRKSKNQKEAFEFLKYLSSKESLSKLYSAQSKIREFGEPYPRVDMASLVTADPVVSVVVSQAQNAKSWFLAGFTFDGETGINSKIGKYYQDAVNAVLGSETPEKAMETVTAGVEQVLAQYGIR